MIFVCVFQLIFVCLLNNLTLLVSFPSLSEYPSYVPGIEGKKEKEKILEAFVKLFIVLLLPRTLPP